MLQISIDESSQCTVKLADSDDEEETVQRGQLKLLQELEEEKKVTRRLIEQNEQLLQQWDDALVYVEQVSYSFCCPRHFLP